MSITTPPTTSPPTITSSTTTPAPTFIALTTQFPQPASCQSIYLTTSIVTRAYWSNYTIVTLPLQFSDPSDPRFTSCQPPDWSDLDAATRFNAFSPALCPSGWTAHTLRTVYTSAVFPSTTVYRQVMTAHCCASGFTPDWRWAGNPPSSLPNLSRDACYAPLATNANVSDRFFPTAGVRVHNAWVVQWAASDTASMTPAPPELTCYTGLQSWAPGETLAAETCPPDPKNDGFNFPMSLFWFLAVGIPLIFVASVAACCVCYWRSRRSRKRRELAQAQTEPPSVMG